MKGNTKKEKVIWVIYSVLTLCINYLLCRYAFFQLHQMKQWPTILVAAGVAVIVLASFFSAYKIMTCTVMGYMGSFIIGVIFNTQAIDQGGGATNTLWKIWLMAYIAFILVGIIWELVSKRKNKI